MAYNLTITGAELQALLNFTETKVETTLFSGNTTGDITLSESAANFSELVVYYEGYNNTNPQTMTIASPNGKRINLAVVEDSAGGGTRVRRTAYDISGTSMAVVASGSIAAGFTLLNGTAVSQNLTENVIHVTKVVGRG